jgi:uncharacterized protein (TIGR02145 family)
MKKYTHITYICFFLFLLIACKKVERDNQLDGFALVETKNATNLDGSSVAIGAKVDRIDETVTISQRGICYSVQKNPTIDDSIVINGSGYGEFETTISTLTGYTTYYARAFAKTSKGVAYGNQVLFTSNGYGSKISDLNGNSYKTVAIAGQFWMAENLKASSFNDGTSIPQVKDKFEWDNSAKPAWSFYNNDFQNNSVHGKLYNWYAIHPSTNGNKNICPIGWHVPSIAEVEQLKSVMYSKKLEMQSDFGWEYTNGTNSSGFNGTPSGTRSSDYGFMALGRNAMWWTTSEVYSYSARTLQLRDVDEIPQTFTENKVNGLSVRCVMDNP